MKLKSTLTLLFSICLFISNIHSKHIMGGYMDYTVISKSGSNYLVEINLSVFRDPYGGGASFDDNLELGLYRVLPNGELEHVNTYIGDPIEIIEIQSDLLNCEGTLPQYELGRYKMEISVPDDGSDYQVAYQRCCRSNSIVGILDVEDSGMLFTTRISYEALTSLNTSPQLTDVDDRFFVVNQMNNVDMSFIDIDGDEIVITPAIPYEVGGVDGVNGGSANSCEGITPSPLDCPPLFEVINYASGFSLENPLGPSGDFMDNGNGEFSFTSQSIGMYLLGFKIEEFRNGELLTTSNYETTVIIGLQEANNAFGQLYLDENENGIYDAGETPFPIAPEVLNEFCNYTVDEDHKYDLLLEDEIANFQNVAQNYTFTNGTNLISSPVLNLTQSTEFDIGFVGLRNIEEVSMNIYNELSLCNEEGELFVELFNLGTVATEGEIVISNISNMTILDCNCDYTIDGDNIVIQVSSLDPLQTLVISFFVLYGDESQVGEAVTASAEYTSTINQNITASADFDDILLCAVDPNDITVTPARLPNYIVENHERLIVKIRFENMGNYFASKVSIDQVLDFNLDRSSLKVLESSHPYRMMTSRNNQDQLVKFLFEDINLPGTNSPIQSDREGHIIYAIDIKPNRAIGTMIKNRAEIIFDLNQPIITNTVTNIIGVLEKEQDEEEDEEIVIEEQQVGLTIYPNPAENRIYIKSENDFVRYFISNSAQKYLKEGDMIDSVSIDDLLPGIYMITFVAENGYRASKKFVKTDIF